MSKYCFIGTLYSYLKGQHFSVCGKFSYRPPVSEYTIISLYWKGAAERAKLWRYEGDESRPITTIHPKIQKKKGRRGKGYRSSVPIWNRRASNNVDNEDMCFDYDDGINSYSFGNNDDNNWSDIDIDDLSDIDDCFDDEY